MLTNESHERRQLRTLERLQRERRALRDEMVDQLDALIARKQLEIDNRKAGLTIRAIRAVK